MNITISTKNFKKSFDKNDINIGSQKDCDVMLDLGFSYLLTLHYDENTKGLVLLNPFNNQNFIVDNLPLNTSYSIDSNCLIQVKKSDEFISIALGEKMVNAHDGYNLDIDKETEISQDDLKAIYGEGKNAQTMFKLDQRKTALEQVRVKVTKQSAFAINAITEKISMNRKTQIITHIGLVISSIFYGFGVSNYLTGLKFQEAANILRMPDNIKAMLMYSFLIFALGLILKQGIFLFLQNRSNSDVFPTSKLAEKFLLVMSLIFFSAFFVINLLYYMTPDTLPFFALLISLFFSITVLLLAAACGYFKSNNMELSEKLDKLEYREDFEKLIKEYQKWITLYINNLGKNKIESIKDKLFNLQLKAGGETLLGILTAPFLAYGVSNTLALCFPEAAGWVRISGMRFSPIFLVLATFLIIFAFFAFVNAYLLIRKIQGSNVLKTDGFSNFMQHGVEIFGLEGIKKLELDKKRSFIIAIVIILIEFTMNTSYFMKEIGDDLGGISLSIIAALVPTALLIAETYMLSQTKYDIFACSSLLDKRDID